MGPAERRLEVGRDGMGPQRTADCRGDGGQGGLVGGGGRVDGRVGRRSRPPAAPGGTTRLSRAAGVARATTPRPWMEGRVMAINPQLTMAARVRHPARAKLASARRASRRE